MLRPTWISTLAKDCEIGIFLIERDAGSPVSEKTSSRQFVNKDHAPIKGEGEPLPLGPQKILPSPRFRAINLLN
jgi:hypothetical protein